MTTTLFCHLRCTDNRPWWKLLRGSPDYDTPTLAKGSLISICSHVHGYCLGVYSWLNLCTRIYTVWMGVIRARLYIYIFAHLPVITDSKWCRWSLISFKYSIFSHYSSSGTSCPALLIIRSHLINLMIRLFNKHTVIRAFIFAALSKRYTTTTLCCVGILQVLSLIRGEMVICFWFKTSLLTVDIWTEEIKSIQHSC